MSNESGLNLQYPLLITGGDGSTLWVGCGVIGSETRAINSDTAAISPGQAVAWDAAATLIQCPDQAASVAPIQQYAKVRRAITTGGYDIFVGVAVTKAAVGEVVVIAGNGSVVPVACVGTTARYNLVASTTAGTVTAQSAIVTAPGGNLGHVVKYAGATGGATDSGSASYNIAAISIS